MLLIVGIPATVHQGMAPYRDLFCRDQGFEHIERYVTGLLLSPNQTLQGMHNLHIWRGPDKPSRRAMPAAVFEAGWDAGALMKRHRAEIAKDHRGRGRRAIFPWPTTRLIMAC